MMGVKTRLTQFKLKRKHTVDEIGEGEGHKVALKPLRRTGF